MMLGLSYEFFLGGGFVFIFSAKESFRLFLFLFFLLTSIYELDVGF